jgi:hypothetical protein
VVADPTTVVLLGGGDIPYRVTHPADEGDACTILAVQPTVLQMPSAMPRLAVVRFAPRRKLMPVS